MGYRKRRWGGKPPTEGYQRNVDHCEVSGYVKPVTIKELTAIEGADRIVKATFHEVAYETVVPKADYAVGDMAMWIPGESILPLELSEKLGITKRLSKGRVKTVRLKKTRSEGLLEPIDVITPYLDKIMKWESPISIHPAFKKHGEKFNPKHMRWNAIPGIFERFYKMPNLLNEPSTFRKGELVFIGEKHHGMSSRIALLDRPSLGWLWNTMYAIAYWVTGKQKYNREQYYVGTHNTVVMDLPGGHSELFWTAFKRNILNRGIPKNFVFFGELYGSNLNGAEIQKGYSYGEDGPKIKLFAAIDVKTEKYLKPGEFALLCDQYYLPRVSHVIVEYDSIEQMREYANGQSAIDNKTDKEGCVIVAADNGRRMAKVINFEYLTKKRRTEFH